MIINVWEALLQYSFLLIVKSRCGMESEVKGSSVNKTLQYAEGNPRASELVESVFFVIGIA